MSDKPSTSSQVNKYAVVQFENFDISVVPIIWLDEPDYCYWPTGVKSIRTAIVKEMPVKDNFDKYKLSHIFSKHDTYESAIKAEKQALKASESEGESRATGKRKTTKNKNENYSNPPRLVLFNKESQKSASTPNNGENVIEPNTQQGNLQADILTEANIDSVPIQIISSENPANLTGLTGLTDLTGLNFTKDLETILNNIETEIKTIKERQEQSLTEILETTKLILAKINSDQYGKEYSNVQDNKIKKHFPLTSIQSFLNLDDILKTDQEAFMQMVNKILQIGGKSEKDFVRRALITTFDDNLACMCSWTGQKNNFKIGDTHIIQSIKKAFKATFPRSTEKDFEQFVMEWFRFANVRKQKKEFSRKEN